MRAVILAAGRGRRLREATEERPKCLVEVAGRALVDHQVGALRGAGIDDIVIVTGYRADMLTGRGFETRHNPAWSETNMVASLLCAADVFDGPTIVSYADIVYPAEFVIALADTAQHADVAIAYDPQWLELWSRRFDDPLEDAETFRVDGDRVAEIGARPTDVAEVEGQYIGLLGITPTGLSWFQAALTTHGPALDCTMALRQLIADGRTVRAVPVHGPWCEIDGPRDLEVAESVLEQRAGASW